MQKTTKFCQIGQGPKNHKNATEKPVWAKLKNTVHKVYTQIAGKAPPSGRGKNIHP